MSDSEAIIKETPKSDSEKSAGATSLQRSTSRQGRVSRQASVQQQLEPEDAYDNALKTIKANRRFLTKQQRRAKERVNNVYMTNNPSTTEISSQSGESSDSDYDRGSRPRRKLVKKGATVKINKRAERLPRLMDRYEALFGNRLLNKDDPENQELFTIMNALSRQNIDKAMAQERNLHHIGTPQHPYVTPPKIRNNQISGSAKLRDCLVTLRDIQRTPTDGTTSEGIAPYLTTVSRIAEGSNLDIPSFYDLLKSRIIVDSTLYKEVSRHQKMNTSPTALYKSLCISYQPDNGYLSNLQKYQKFNGTGCNASQFITKLKSLSYDVVDASDAGTFSEDRVYQLVRDKTFALLPNIAPYILDKLSLYRVAPGGDMNAFTEVFMQLKDRINLQLAKSSRRSVNRIDDFRHQEQADYYNRDSDSEDEIAEKINQLKRLTQSELAQFEGKCFKCGNTSPIQK